MKLSGNQLKLAISVSHLAHKGNMAVQFFARYFEISDIENSEKVWIIEDFQAATVKSIVKSEMVDREIGMAFFNDPDRMYADVMADGTARALIDYFGSESLE
jgi:hypothetical protein